jgi:peptidoglycan hydrolase-like protein with peptidoglycan-binding domain
LTPGASGPDVAQLELALERLGHSPGPVDDVYDASTEAAVEALHGQLWA